MCTNFKKSFFQTVSIKELNSHKPNGSLLLSAREMDDESHFSLDEIYWSRNNSYYLQKAGI